MERDQDRKMTAVETGAEAAHGQCMARPTGRSEQSMFRGLFRGLQPQHLGVARGKDSVEVGQA